MRSRVRRTMLTVTTVVSIGLAGCSADADEAADASTAERTGGSTSVLSESGASVGTEASAPGSSTPEQVDGSTPPPTTGTLQDAPTMVVPPLFDDATVEHGLQELPGIVEDAMDRTGVPGVAVGVIHQDQVVFAEGFGVRRVGEPDTIDPDTVFQVASMSKPVSSTIVAGVVGQGEATWTDPVSTWYPEFALSDPYVTENATIADLMSHRTGLKTGSGDLLEDLGWDQAHILPLLAQQPLDAFRSTYNYSNFAYTLGGMSAAAAAQQAWEDLADDVLLGPLGMTSSSYRHDDYLARQNRASIHTRVGPAEDKAWESRYERDADAEAPAGGLSSSVNDMLKFARLQLGNGTVESTEIIDGGALQVTHVPHNELSQPTTPGERTQFYGLGWNVSYDDQGREQLGHSGAFLLGAATTITLLPTEQLGIVTLTNGQAHGIPEAINNSFLDVLKHGELTVDWLDFFGDVFEEVYYTSAVDPRWTTPPTNPAPPAADSAYVGTYQNSYYGPLTVTSDGGALSMSMGPPDSPTKFILTPFDGDTFTFDTIGENASGKSGAQFTLGPDGTATSVTLTYYDQTGLGTFTR